MINGKENSNLERYILQKIRVMTIKDIYSPRFVGLQSIFQECRDGSER